MMHLSLIVSYYETKFHFHQFHYTFFRLEVNRNSVFLPTDLPAAREIVVFPGPL